MSAFIIVTDLAESNIFICCGCIYRHMCVHAREYACLWVCYVCRQVCVCVCMYVWVNMCIVFMCVYVYAYVCECMFGCMCAFARVVVCVTQLWFQSISNNYDNSHIKLKLYNITYSERIPRSILPERHATITLLSQACLYVPCRLVAYLVRR